MNLSNQNWVKGDLKGANILVIGPNDFEIDKMAPIFVDLFLALIRHQNFVLVDLMNESRGTQIARGEDPPGHA